MRRFSIVMLTGLAACAGTLYSATSTTSRLAPPDAYSCVRAQMDSLGYRRTHYDPSENWYVGQRTEPDARVADVRFRQRVSRLDVRIQPNASGNADMDIKAQSFDQYDNQQGFSEVEVSASDQARRDAARIASACAG